MKTKLTLLILLVFAYSINFGQIALTHWDHTPKVEYRYHYESVSLDFSSLTYSGNDTLWDISYLTYNSDSLSFYYTRDTTYNSFPGYEYNYDFNPPPDPNDTSIIRSENAIYRVTDSEFYQAYKVRLPLYWEPFGPYIDETHIPILNFPFQLSDSMDAGSEYINYEAYYLNKQTWKKADSYGTLVLPDTVLKDVLRVYTYLSKYESLSHDFSDLTLNKYEWYHKDYQLPVFSIVLRESKWLSGGSYSHSFDSTAWLFNSKSYISPTFIPSYDLTNKSIEVFPCPSKDRIFLRSNQVLTGIRIVDLRGKSVLTIRKHQLLEINVSSLSNGVYILYAQFDDGSYLSKKVIVAK